MRNHKTYLTMLAAGLLLWATGCQRESQQTRSVETTTGQGTTSAPSSKEAEKRDAALVRMVNAMPNAPAVDTFAGDAKTFTGVGYKQVTPYKEVPDDRLTFRVRPAGKDTAEPLAENSEGLYGGKHYTVIAMPSTWAGSPRATPELPVSPEAPPPVEPRRRADGWDLKVLSDNLTPPPSGKAKVRVVHASPDAGEVDIFGQARDKSLFSGVNFGTETMYAEVEPMSGTLQVRPEGKPNTLLSIPNVNFEAGKIYTIILAGKTKGAPRLEAIKIEDRFGTHVAGEAGQQTSPKRSAY